MLLYGIGWGEVGCFVRCAGHLLNRYGTDTVDESFEGGMMKTGRWKRFLGMVAVVLMLAMGIGASAAESGTIVIRDPQQGVTYTIYLIFAGSVDADGESFAYTATEEQVEFYTAKEGNPFVFEENTLGSYNVSVSEETDEDGNSVYSDRVVTEFLRSVLSEAVQEGIVTEITDYVSERGTAEDGTQILTISGLPDGYYYVTSNVGSVIAITSTTQTVEIDEKIVPAPEEPEEPGEPDEPGDSDDGTTTEEEESEGGESVGISEENGSEPTVEESAKVTASVSVGNTLAQTGQLNWPIPVLAVCGMMLMALGFTIDRKNRAQEEDQES